MNKKDENPQREHENQPNVQDTNAEALAKGTTPERVAQHNPQSGKSSATQGRGKLQDGYSETEGSEYQQANPPSEEEYYDPTHSGVRHAQNKPGKRVATPGRDEGTAWSEQAQMGRTTDVPDRKNPAD